MWGVTLFSAGGFHDAVQQHELRYDHSSHAIPLFVCSPAGGAEPGEAPPPVHSSLSAEGLGSLLGRAPDVEQ